MILHKFAETYDSVEVKHDTALAAVFDRFDSIETRLGSYRITLVLLR